MRKNHYLKELLEEKIRLSRYSYPFFHADRLLDKEILSIKRRIESNSNDNKLKLPKEANWQESRPYRQPHYPRDEGEIDDDDVSPLPNKRFKSNSSPTFSQSPNHSSANQSRSQREIRQKNMDESNRMKTSEKPYQSRPEPSQNYLKDDSQFQADGSHQMTSGNQPATHTKPIYSSGGSNESGLYLPPPSVISSNLPPPLLRPIDSGMRINHSMMLEQNIPPPPHYSGSSRSLPPPGIQMQQPPSTRSPAHHLQTAHEPPQMYLRNPGGNRLPQPEIHIPYGSRMPPPSGHRPPPYPYPRPY